MRSCKLSSRNFELRNGIKGDRRKTISLDRFYEIYKGYLAFEFRSVASKERC